MVERVDAVNRPPYRIRYGWPLYSDDWELLPVDVSGTGQWQSRPLGHASKQSIPPVSGVYMMCARPRCAVVMAEPFRSLMDIIYVGRSKNLRTRYSQHLNTPSPKVRAARMTYSDSLRFWFLQIPKDRISAVESVLIKCFGPPANDQPGDVLSLDIGTTRKA